MTPSPPDETAELRRQLAEKDAANIRKLEEQLAAHQQQLAEKDARLLDLLERQAQEKDRTIERLAKQPRVRQTTNHISSVDVQTLNVFGKEPHDYFTTEQLRTLMRDPATAIPKLVYMKHVVGKPENRNVYCPNKRDNRYLVVERAADRRKMWVSKAKERVLDDLYEEGDTILQGYVELGEPLGERYQEYHEKLRKNPQLMRAQYAAIHNAILNVFDR